MIDSSNKHVVYQSTESSFPSVIPLLGRVGLENQQVLRGINNYHSQCDDQEVKVPREFSQVSYHRTDFFVELFFQIKHDFVIENPRSECFFSPFIFLLRLLSAPVFLVENFRTDSEVEQDESKELKKERSIEPPEEHQYQDKEVEGNVEVISAEVHNAPEFLQFEAQEHWTVPDSVFDMLQVLQILKELVKQQEIIFATAPLR
jgi:hypothetical protein